MPPLTDTERAYITLCWTVWQVGVDLWWERWGVSAGRTLPRQEDTAHCRTL